VYLVTLSLDEELAFAELVADWTRCSRERNRRLFLLSFLMFGAGISLLVVAFMWHWPFLVAAVGYLVMISGAILNAWEVAELRAGRQAAPGMQRHRGV
jgi:hypothetical protein